MKTELKEGGRSTYVAPLPHKTANAFQWRIYGRQKEGA